MSPLYTTLSPGQWEEKITLLKGLFSPCRLCPRQCEADRASGKQGACQAENRVKIASYNLHFGEEPPISGDRGSGTVFYSGCTLKCRFCQNFPISHLFNGRYYTVKQLADIFLDLQNRGAHNINFVSPTPYLYHAALALREASVKGLRIPIVYNTSGYERLETIRALDRMVDIYLPDYKYRDNGLAQKFSGVNNYVEHADTALAEMFQQVGELEMDEEEIGIRGMIIRHLILPGFVENSKKVLKRISQSSFNKSFLSLMSQYFPAYRATWDPEVGRRLQPREYRQVKEYALSLGFDRGWFQDM